MDRNIRIARELVRIAKMMIAAGENDDLIENREEFEKFADEMKYEKNKIFSTKEQTIYAAYYDTFFSFQLGVRDDGVYYGYEARTADDVLNGEDALADLVHPIIYSKYPFKKSEFDKFVKDTIEVGVEQGKETTKNAPGYNSGKMVEDVKDYYRLD